ncbi:MAG: glycerophosphodiester phosphodiesterase family protein [Gammaproteobacteria bacterium]
MAELVAHRGSAAQYPENTLVALAAALAAGVRWLECDVQLSADHVPVLLHDADLKRTGGDPRDVFDLDVSSLATISVHEPLRLGRAYEPTRVPRLAEAVELVGEHAGATLFVEVKHESIERFGLEAVMNAVRAALTQDCVVISFHDGAIARAREFGLRTGWVAPEWSERAREIATSLAPDFLFTNIKRVPDGAALWPGPWRWAAYDARDAEEALSMAARGFEFVETKAVGELLLDPRIAAWLRP